MVRQTDFAEQKCPRDCPFLDRLCGGTSYRFCSYTLYARSLDPDRLTRTTVSPDGKVDYHIPPHCDIYEKYKDRSTEIKQLKKRVGNNNITIKRSRTEELSVFGKQHIPRNMHHGDF